MPAACEKSSTGFTYEYHPILHPHRIISFLFDHVGMIVSESDCAEFWKHAISVKEPWALGFDQNDPDLLKRVPLGLYGDGAQLVTKYKVEKTVAIFFNVLLHRPRSIRFSRFLLYSVDEKKLLSNRTLNAVYRRLVWSFQALFDGLNPTTGPHGRPLGPRDASRAGLPIVQSGRKFCVVEIRGDWSWQKQSFHFRASWKGKQVCHQCGARSQNDQGNGLLYWKLGWYGYWLCGEYIIFPSSWAY